MTNLEYWEMRSHKRQERNEADALEVLKKMDAAYKEVRNNIESDLFSIFGRFMSDNGLSVTDAQEMLSGQEFKRWRKSLADYMKEIEAVGVDSLEGQALWLEVEVLSARSRISRLDALHALIGANMAQVAAVQEKAVAEHLEALYYDDFMEGGYDFYKMGLETAVDAAESGALALSNAFVHEVITEPWSGAMFSSRIWKNEWNMAQRVSEMVGRSLIAGHSTKRIARDIEEALGVDRRNAERLILTESAHVKTEADLQLFNTLDIRRVEFHATLDNRTCEEECAQHDGEIIAIKDLKDGINKPPLHPRCRCVLLPYNEALASVKKHEKRIARNAEGKNIRVDGNMTYKEWRKMVGLPEVEDIKNKQQDAVKKNPLDECVSVKDVEMLMLKQRWFADDFEDDVSLEGCTLETAKGVYSACDKVFSKYPRLKGAFMSIDMEEKSPRAYASCTTGEGFPSVHLNRRFFDDADKIKKLYNNDVDDNFHPEGTSWEGIVVHELGHAIDDYLTNAFDMVGVKRSGTERYFSSELRRRTLDALGMSVSTIEENVSIYATHDNCEWMAECFVEYLYSPNPRPMAVEFGRQLELALEEVM